jgi:Ca-activated chloride channel homolog
MKKLTIAMILVVVIVLVGSSIMHIRSCEILPVTVVHWSNSHLMRSGLMNEMADQFNQEQHWTRHGQRIEIQVFNYGSAEQSDDLAFRIKRGVPLVRDVPNPTIVTPSSADWLIRANQAVRHTLVDTAASRSIVSAYIGIVTYRDMAECLGWPDKQIGYADIIALRNDPRGWASYPTARAEWGQRPLVAFTDPITSTTGRSVLFSLYAIAANKSPRELDLADVSNPQVIGYVKRFQSLIDHYMIGTVPLNTKVYQGPRYGHFFLMPEDNLIHLYEGTEYAFIDGKEVQAPPIQKPMVMIYPREGSMVRNNIAGMVQAPWVTPDQREGAERWVDFLLQDRQQKAFMQAGFRPGSQLSLADPASRINGKYGLDPEPQTPLLSPELIDPAVADSIEKAWPEVKRPGIVTFVVDISGSMSGKKINQARQGMIRALDSMASNNQVGFLTFSDTVSNQVPVAPLTLNRYIIADIVQRMTVQSSTALYDAIKSGIQMTDSAEGDSDAIRAVVVLTDGQANQGVTRMDSIVRMMSVSEVNIREFRGYENDSTAFDTSGRPVAKKDILGSGLAMSTRHPVQVFFIGIGDADMEVGRILSQATGAEFQGVADQDLAQLLEQFSKYF